MSGLSLAPTDDVSEQLEGAIERAIEALPSDRRLILESWYHDQPVWLAIEDVPRGWPHRAAQVAVVRLDHDIKAELTVEIRRRTDNELILPRVARPTYVSIKDVDSIGFLLRRLWMDAEEATSNVRLPQSARDDEQSEVGRLRAVDSAIYQAPPPPRVSRAVVVAADNASEEIASALFDLSIVSGSRRIDPAELGMRLEIPRGSVQLQLELDHPVRRKVDLINLRVDESTAISTLEGAAERLSSTKAVAFDALIHYELRQAFWILLEAGRPEAFRYLDFAGIGRVQLSARWVIRWNDREGRWYYARGDTPTQ